MGLNDKLRNPFTSPHDVGGIHRFICRYKRKAFHSSGFGREGPSIAALNVVLHPDSRVCLNQGHMLVSCGVEDYFSPFPF